NVAQMAAVQFRKQVGCDFVARLDRRRRITVNNELVAEVLDHEQPRSAITGKDGRRREAKSAQGLRHRNKRRHALCQMRNRTVGFTVAYRRSVRSLWRIHQDVSCAFAGEPLVTAGGGVALDAAALCLAKARAVEEIPDRENTLGPRHKTAKTRDTGVSCALSALWRKGQFNIEPVDRQ